MVLFSFLIESISLNMNPWGKDPRISVFINLENVSIKDRESYFYEVLLSMKWWENDKNHDLRLGIPVWSFRNNV